MLINKFLTMYKFFLNFHIKPQFRNLIDFIRTNISFQYNLIKFILTEITIKNIIIFSIKNNIIKNNAVITYSKFVLMCHLF